MSSENNPSTSPFISIGLPTYNRPEFTRLALKSCLDQDYPHFEVIISDDSKDDQIQKIVESFASNKVRYIKNDPPLGIPAKLNDLLEKAKGPWMVLLGDDDLFEPGFLSTVARILKEHPDAALVHPRCGQIDLSGKLLHTDKVQKPSMGPAEFLDLIFRPWYEMRVSITGFVYPVQALRRLGGFQDFYMGYFCDNIAWAMLGAQGTSYFAEAPLCALRENPNSISRDFTPDHRRLIESRERTARLFSDILKTQAVQNSGRAGVDAAQARFSDCLLSDTRDFLDRIFVQSLKKKDGNVAEEVKQVFDAAKGSKLPLLDRRFAFYAAIAGWPAALRFAALGLYRKLRQARIALFGPKTFSEKAHYYRTHLSKVASSG